MAEILEEKETEAVTNVTEEEDAEALAMQQRVEEMEEEQESISGAVAADSEKISVSEEAAKEENSIYIGQVDYEATPDELRGHFAQCGTINRITILCDKFTGMAKGYAYIEFVDKASADNAVKLNDTTFKGRQLKVNHKRQNVPSARGGRGRGRGGYGRGPPRGRGGGGFRGGFRGGRGGRGGYFGGRGRGRGGYNAGYY
jgi:polyadenylate-binding protein 2